MTRFKIASRMTFAVLATAVLSLSAYAQPRRGPGPEVLATVNGAAITESDLAGNDRLLSLEREYKRNRQTLLEEALRAEIQDRILEAEAKEKGITKDQLLASIAPEPITQEAINQVYEENRAQLNNVPLQQVEGQIRQFLGQRAQQTAREKFFEGLADKYKVDVRLEPIREVVAAKGPAKGPANATVTIVEFSEFQCPFCARVNPAFAQVMETYGDKVRIVFRQFPLDFHQHAQKAAEASLCAADQGKFWELHDAMFANQNALAVEQIKAKAVELGLDAAKFNACVDSGEKAPVVAQDKRDGEAAGVTGTPGMFINGRFVNGAVPFSELAVIIDDELRRKGISQAGK